MDYKWNSPIYGHNHKIMDNETVIFAYVLTKQKKHKEGSYHSNKTTYIKTSFANLAK